MATLIKGLLAFNLDWQFVMVGVALAATVELCGVGVAVVRGRRLPAAVDDRADLRRRRGPGVRGARARASAGGRGRHAESELGPGNLFATGLVAGGAVAGVAIALVTVTDRWARVVGALSIEHGLVRTLGAGGYQLLGLACFAAMGADALARGAPASRRQQKFPATPRAMVHGRESRSTRRRPAVNHNACKAKIDKLWKETSGHLATRRRRSGSRCTDCFAPVIDLIEVKNVCVLHLYEVPNAVAPAPRRATA